MEKEVGYSETDKRLPVGGKILLFFMILFLVLIGEAFYWDLGNIPKAPEPLSHCADYYTYDYGYDYGYKSDCQYSSYEKLADVPQKAEKLRPTASEISELRNQLSSHQNLLYSYQEQLREANSNYNLALQEEQAGSGGPYSQQKSAYLKQIQDANSRIASENSQISSLNSQISGKESGIKSIRDGLRAAIEKANALYQRAYRIYTLKIVGLQFLFISPLFFISLYYYLKSKKKESRYTSIATGFIFASSLLFTHTVLYFFYYIIPRDILIEIWEFLNKVPFFRYIIYYVGMGLVALLFGGSVYILLKRMYSPERVRKRRLMKEECPSCGFPLKLSKFFCSKCGKQIYTSCKKCKQPRLIDSDFCSNCGSK